ncbi:MAG: response regulator, partial [Cyanobacteriota bacterium]
MARSQRIWVVDDDPELGRMLVSYLGDQGYEVRILHDGAQLLARLQGRLGGERPDLLVLDLMLPGDDGLQLLRRLRDGGDDLPVVMLTARADAVDRIIGLEQGADDYLAKPFLPRELSARIEAVLRRRIAVAAAGGAIATAEPVQFGECVLDPAARSLERAGLAVPITSGEFALLV